MTIEGTVDIGMFYYNGRSISATYAGKDNLTLAGGTNRGSDRYGYIDPMVQNGPSATEWIESPANTRSDDAVLDRQLRICQCYNRKK